MASDAVTVDGSTSEADRTVVQASKAQMKGVKSTGKQVEVIESEEESSGSASDVESAAESEPVKMPKKRKSKGGSDDKPTKAKKAKKVKESNAVKSKEFIDSEGNPVSTPPNGLDIEPESKRKAKSEKTTKPKASTSQAVATKEGKGKKVKAPPGPQYGGTEEQEAEIRKLKEIVNACGAKIAQKQLSELGARDVIKRLEEQLTMIGMKKPFSLNKAKTIKSERELEKEVADIGGSRRVDTEAARASRSTGSSKPMWLPGRTASDDEMEKVDVRKEKVKDRRAMNNAKVFHSVLKAEGELD